MLSTAGALCLTSFLVAAPSRDRLVVLEVVAGDASTRSAARLVEEQLATELGRAGQFEVTGQSEITAALGLERQRQLIGCSESSCFAEIGGALNARWLVMGSLGRFGKALRLDLKLVDARQGKAVAREGKVLTSDDELFPAVSQFVLALVEAAAPQPANAKGAAAPWVIGGAGVVGLAGGAALMVLGGAWGAELNKGNAQYTWAEAQARMGTYQGLYWGGASAAAVGAVAVGVGLWLFARPSEPVPAAAASVALSPSGFEVRW